MLGGVEDDGAGFLALNVRICSDFTVKVERVISQACKHVDEH